MEWYTIKNIEETDSPALVIFPDRIRHNIREALKMVGNANRLQPHVKTFKMPEVVKMMQEEGINKFKCSTIAEAEMLGNLHAEKVLFAMQPVGIKIDRLISLIKKFPDTRFSCLVDCALAASDIAERFLSADLTANIYIDLNVGMNRTGIDAGTDALELYIFCDLLEGVHIEGLHAYDGHLRNPIVAERSAIAEQAFEKVIELQLAIERAGFAYPSLIAGGSPGFPYHSTKTDRISSPGTFALWDYGYSVNCPELNFLPAAVLICRVISRPDEKRICVDLGHKSVAAENELTKRVHFLNAPDLKAIGHSEEHLILEVEDSDMFKPGEILYGLPYHICPTVALYDHAQIAYENRITGSWEIPARKRKITL